MNPKNLFTAYQLARQGQKYYGVGMKFIDRIKNRVRLVIIGAIIYALVVLALLVYIATRLT